VNAAARGLSAALALDEVRDALNHTLDAEPGPRLSRDASEAIRAATKVDDGWAILKRSGLSGLPQGDPSAAGQRLVDQLADHRVFVVPEGELERWHPTVPNKGPSWLNDVISEELHVAHGSHVDFMRAVDTSFSE
jgi:hypothetical protein